MADNLIFPVGFDLEKGVKDAQAQMDSALRRLQKTADGKPLTIPMSLDASKFTTFEAALRGSIQHITDDAKNLKAALDSSLQTDNSANINRITEAMRSLEAAWKALPNNQKFDINDRLTPKAQEMVRQFNELATASSTYGQTLSQIAGKIKRAADEEAKANQKRNDGYAKLRKTLGAQENSIANLSAKIKAYQQILNSKEIGSKSFERVAEKIRKLTEQLDKAKAKVAELTGKAQSGATRQSAAVKQVSNEFKNQETYVSRLIKRMAVYASFSYAGNFLTSIREVTAQFELQRVSLGAILQDQAKAEVLFGQIKGLALESPVSVLDLTKYTKQLAAYKIGYDELFETTKRLTDVSVGLGVSMDRIILAYGQIRAAGYLRASEVRQLTEAGIPIVEELAKKISDANGELVTSAKVMDMISKREIPFEMVADVFEDMTDKGGIFYNMQEKQADTLYGLWQKLGDAASIMYAEIGNVGPINSGMKTLIEALRSMMKHWNVTAVAIMAVAGAMVKMKIASMNAALATAHQTTAHAAHIATLRTEIAMGEAYCHTVTKGTFLTRLDAQAKLAASRANLAAAQSSNVLTASFYRLKAAMLSNPYTLVITALLTLGTVIYEVFTAANELDNKFEEIDAKYAELSRTAPKNFEKLAEAAVHAADGSKKQKDALDELKRTYGEMLPAEALQIENLRALGGAYEMLTNQVKAYYEQQRHEERVAAIKENWAAVIREEKDDIEDRLANQGASDKQIAIIMDYIDEAYINGEDLEKALKEGAKDAGFDKGDFESIVRGVWNSGAIASTLRGDWSQVLANAGALSLMASHIYNRVGEDTNALSEAAGGLSDALAREDERFKETINTLNKYHEMVETITAQTANIQNREGPGLGWISSLLFETDITKWNLDDPLDLANAQIENMGLRIKGELEKAGVTVQEGWFEFGKSVKEGGTLHGVIDFPAIIEAAVKAGKTDLAVAIKELQPVYQQIAPSDETVRGLWAKVQQIGRAYKLSAADIRGYSIKAGESLSKYRKRLEDEEEQIADAIAKLTLNMTMLKFFGDSTEASEKAIAELKEKAAAIKEILGAVGRTPTKGGGRGSDQRLQNLKEEISLLQKLYTEYKKLEKQEGATRAAEDMRKLAETTIDMFKSKYEIDLPTNANDLASSLEILYKKMEALGTKAFPTLQKDLNDLRWTIENVKIEDAQKNIEAELNRLADRISRTKTAKEFYEKILGMTGDYELAANIAVQLYGSNGKELGEQIKEQFRLAFATLDKPDVDVSAKIGDLIDKGRYEELRNYIALLPEAQRKAAEDLVKAQQQMSAKQYEQWLKDLKKAKDYADKRIELSRYTANQIAAIEERIAKLDPAATDYEQQKEMLQKLIDGYKSRERKEEAGLEYEQFKNSALYVQVFENLDNASKTALENMRNRLIALKDQWKNLSPQQVKELTKRLEELDAQIAQRSPFKSIADSIKKLRDMRMGGRTKEGDAQKAFDAEADRKAAEAKMLADEKAYEAAVKQYGAESNIAKAKRKIADDSTEAYRNTEKTADSADENADEWENVAEAINAANQKLDKYQEQINEALSGVRKLMESFGASSEDMQLFDDVTNGFNEIFDAGQQGAEAYASFMMGDFVGAATKVISAVGSLISGVTNLFYAGRVKRANKEIKRQQELLEQLEYTYGRLQDAADKLFGRDYVNNYNQQLKNLQAQQTAYLKQAEAERSKGKKKDKDKIKEYEEAARDTADKIKELQDDLVAHFTGSTKTDVARQMAKSWVDAKASMSDTFAAIKGDYADMVKNMLVEGAAARVIENALTPVWDSMEKMLAKNDVEGAIDSLVNGMDSALNAANNGMEVLWKALEARGYDMKKLISDTDSEYTGIAKNIAGATSEEINTAAAIGNTLLYYAAPIPRIDENLARVVAIMEGRGAALPTASGATTGAVDYTDLFNTANQHLSSLPRMERHLAEIHTMLGRALRTKGATTGFNTFLNS